MVLACSKISKRKEVLCHQRNKNKNRCQTECKQIFLQKSPDKTNQYRDDHERLLLSGTVPLAISDYYDSFTEKLVLKFVPRRNNVASQSNNRWGLSKHRQKYTALFIDAISLRKPNNIVFVDSVCYCLCFGPFYFHSDVQYYYWNFFLDSQLKLH